MKISLVGFMGTGKSSVGKLLAEKLNYPFLDTDDLIVNKAGMGIPQIFSKYGEGYFRKLEEEVLRHVVTTGDNFVLATGGGIVISPYNRKLLKDYTTPVLLSASPEVIYERISGDKRPLLFTDDPLEKIKELLAEREQYYSQFDNQVYTGGKEKREVVDEIIHLIGVDRLGL